VPRPERVAHWVERVAAGSERVRVETLARTYQRRPLQVAVVSAAANLARLDALRAAHVEALSSGGGPGEAVPTVVLLTFGIHGDEISPVPAAIQLLHDLSTLECESLQALLDELVILLVPVANPDGFARGAAHVNAHAARVPVSDPQHREHRFDWPRGRSSGAGARRSVPTSTRC